MKHLSIFERYMPILLFLYCLFPLYIVVSASLKGPAQLFLDPFGLPKGIHFKNYVDAWRVGNLARAFRNSGILTLGTILGVLITALPTAYALAKIRFPGEKFLMGYFFFCMTIPPQLFLVPLYYMFAKLGLTNSLGGLILIYIARWSPFSILLWRSYFMEIPGELVEAALVDGASRWQAFRRIVLPIFRPGIVTVIVIVAMWSWNEFLFPLTFLHKAGLEPVTVALAMFRGRWSAAWGPMMAAAISGALPIIALFALLHRRFIAGLARTGLKG